jgi:hypothetical protein
LARKYADIHDPVLKTEAAATTVGLRECRMASPGFFFTENVSK